MKAVVATGGAAAWPEFGGATWVWLQYVLGLRRLGFDTFWVDHLGPVDPLSHHHSLEYLIRRFARTAADFDLEDRYCVVDDEGDRHFGLDEGELGRLASSADVVLGIGHCLPARSPFLAVPRRGYVDVDPGFTQIWAQEVDLGLAHHNFFFTTGQNVGGPRFPIPTAIAWRPILPPVVLSEWPACIDERARRFSTVADWRGSQCGIYDGRYYGSKRDEFVRFLRVPLLAHQEIELALCIGQRDFEDLGLLSGHDWRVLDPSWYAGDPHSFREFVQSSRAEFSAAKSGYVRSNAGWVSDRSACYLASGKPVLVQSTGFEDSLATGKGLLTFSTVDEAVAGIAEINQNYLAHCRAARQLAETHFNSDAVLGSLLEQMGV